ncbi:MAG: magnesium transporter CorA family protein [Bacteroidota bacterium]|nr:magnesium transporter CorA family protein [Bacteroidota bacterium]
MIKYFNIENSKVVQSDKTEQSDIFMVIQPIEEEKKYLMNMFNLDEHTLNSSLDIDEISRLEFEPDHCALVFKRPCNFLNEGKLEFKVDSAGLFLFQNKLIVIVNREFSFSENKIFNRVHSIRELVLKILAGTIQHFMEHLRIISKISDELEGKISAAMENKYLLNLFTLGKSLVYYLNYINANGVLLEKLKLNASKIRFSNDEQELLEDIQIDNNQCYKEAEILSNVIEGLMDARASIVGNNLNVYMKTLGVITLSLMIPTLVVSIFSMNVKLPFGLSNEDPFSFWKIIAISFISFVIFIISWARLKDKL